MKKTHLVLTTGKKSGDGDTQFKTQLESRAARFGIVNSATGAVSSPKLTDPAEAEKLAKRAARFSDIKMSPSTGATTTTATKATPTSNPQDAERLARRAARFADIPKDTSSK